MMENEYDLMDDQLPGDYNDYDEYNDDYQYESMDLSKFDENRLAILAYRRGLNHNFQEDISNLASNCMVTVFWQSYNNIKMLLLLCLSLRIFCFLVNYFCFSNVVVNHVKNSLSFILGLLALHYLFHDVFIHLIGFLAFMVFLTYFLNLSFSHSKNCGIITSFATIMYILVGEFFYSNPVLWNRIRGVLLLMAMKIISVSIDYQRRILKKLPNVFEYCGYCFHPGTIVFGPWVSLQDYNFSLHEKHPLSIAWLLCVVKSIIQAYFCLLLSDCVLSYLFIDKSNVFAPSILPFIAGQWILSYETAVSFHFSHFYISFLATATSLLSGIGGMKGPLPKLKTDEPKHDVELPSDTQPTIVWSNFKITKPLSVEIPHSMLNVVVAWNIPMSKWLKMYIFDSSRFLGDFLAVLFTYAASAMLHGLSLHLAAILLSLGFYTYTEHALRKKLATIFNCPSIQARPKPDDRINTPLYARLFNFAWILVNLMHLTYLGSMFQDQQDETGTGGYSLHYTIAKWSQLSYASHVFAIFCFVFNLLI